MDLTKCGWRATFILCDYAPDSNPPGESPYQNGILCSERPNGYENCANNLCTEGIIGLTLD